MTKDKTRARTPNRARRGKPAWLKVPPPWGATFTDIRQQLRGAALHTVCEAARCPNIGECFGRGTATFLLMGDTCTRNCRFCNIAPGTPAPLDEKEPERVAETVAHLKLRFAVVTSVTRDDLPDGGASHFAATIAAIRRRSPKTGIEVLVPDFAGSLEALETVLAAEPDVLNHNIETVARLYDAVRPTADYRGSLTLLQAAARRGHQGLITKSGFMVGLGETRDEVRQLLADLAAHDVQSVTIGQYLAPSAEHYPLERYVPPAEFDEMAAEARHAGIRWVFSGPLVRSSYHADELANAD